MEFKQCEPLGPFVDALNDYLASLEARQVEALAGEGFDALATAFPAVAAVHAADRPPDERYGMHRAVRALLDNLSLDPPCSGG
jgi:hypothetical protein